MPRNSTISLLTEEGRCPTTTSTKHQRASQKSHSKIGHSSSKDTKSQRYLYWSTLESQFTSKLIKSIVRVEAGIYNSCKNSERSSPKYAEKENLRKSIEIGKPKEMVPINVENYIRKRKNSSICNDSEEEREQLIDQNINHFKRFKEFCPTTMSYYKIIKQIGRGTFGKVYLGKNILCGLPVAIKVFSHAYLQDPYSKGKVQREIQIQRQLSHKNIVKLFEVFHIETHLLIVMEYANSMAFTRWKFINYSKFKRQNSRSGGKAVFEASSVFASTSALQRYSAQRY